MSCAPPKSNAKSRTQGAGLSWHAVDNRLGDSNGCSGDDGDLGLAPSEFKELLVPEISRLE